MSTSDGKWPFREDRGVLKAVTIELLHRSDNVSFESIIGQVALVEPSGRIYAVNEAWSRVGTAQWSDSWVRPGDNFLSTLREAALQGDDYAQSALMGLSSVLSGMIPTFSLTYPASTDRGVRWFNMTASPVARSAPDLAVVMIRQSDQQPAPAAPASPMAATMPSELDLMANALASLTGADSALVFAASGNGNCRLVGQSTVFAVELDAVHSSQDSPCGDESGQDFVFCSSGVQRRYPDAAWLQAAGANGFASMAVTQPDRQHLGEICVLHHGHLEDAFSIEASLRVFAARALAELQRVRQGREIDAADMWASEPGSRYSALLQAMSDGVLVLDSDMRVVDANSSAGQLFGLPASGLIGKRVHELASGASTKALSERNGSWQGVLSVSRPDGRQANLDVSAAVIHARSGTELVVVGHEERGASEAEAPSSDRSGPFDDEREENDAIVRALPDVIFVVSRSGQLVGKREPRVDMSSQAIEMQTAIVEEALYGPYAKRLRKAVEEVIDGGKLVTMDLIVDVASVESSVHWRIFPYGKGHAGILIRVSGDAAGPQTVLLSPEVLKVQQATFRRNPYRLTFRELTILGLLADGATDKAIAEQLCLSIYTVNKHVANILGKMQAASRTEAAVRAAREGLVG